MVKDVVLNKYLISTDVDNTSFHYNEDVDLATVFDSYECPCDTLYEDNPARLTWEILPLKLEFSNPVKINYTEVEMKVLKLLSGSFIDNNFSCEDVVNLLKTDDQEVVSWIKRNFKRYPKKGDVVCFLTHPEGIIKSRGHRITRVDIEARILWMTGINGSLGFDMVSEDMDAHEYPTGLF